MATVGDLYEILGVRRDASQDEIRSAYRALARQHHPDVNADPASEQRFKEVSGAYEILSDPEKRQRYDTFGATGGPAGSPFGAITVDRDACTMCLACVSACPEGALLDHAEAVRLRFIERNCVQCGLCAKTCPEQAIALVPQLDLTAEARAPRLLNEAAMAACTSCGKPLGTQKMVESMLAKLAGHSMFTAPGALERLRMCADCRVVDLMKNEASVDIRTL